MKKRLVSLVALLFLVVGISFSQDSVNVSNPSPVFYSVIVNNVPDEFNYPLIGIINNVNGNHKSVQIGVVNSTLRTFKGFQAAIINSIGDDFYGLQNGWFNSIGRNAYGVECGFINTVGNEMLGVQCGFVNTSKCLKGLQDGFINSVGRNAIGMQNGFINSVGEEFIGLQNGFVNCAISTVGVQNGFINSTKILNGLQLGFINSVDTLQSGVAIGFLSFVKHGGFHAIELSTNENYLLNLSYKIGTKGFYSFPVLSYNPHLSDKFAIGFGFGSNLQVANRLFLNPELSSSFAISNNYREITSFNFSIGYMLNNQLDILAGPTSTWTRSITSTQINHDTSWIFDYNFDFKNDFGLGFKCALRYTL